jgi:hypothetical protein
VSWIDATTVGSSYEVQYNTGDGRFRHRPLTVDFAQGPMDEPIFSSKRAFRRVGEGEWIPGHPDDK